MPRVIRRPRITIDRSHFMKGWGLDFSQSNTMGVETGAGQYSKSTAMSPYNLGKLGQLGPGESFTGLTDSGSVTGLPLNGVPTSNGRSHVIMDDAKIVYIDHTAGDSVAAERTIALSGTHSAHTTLTGTYSDILSYKNATNEYVLYSWTDATDGDVGRMLKDGSSPNDNFLSTTGTQTNGSALTTGVPHVMRTGPDGNIYITNGQYVAQLMPNTSAVNYQALNLGFGFILTDLEIYQNYLVIVGYQATSYFNGAGVTLSEARAWFWDTTSTFYQQTYDLEDNYVSKIYKNSKYLYAFTNGRNNTTKIKVFTGSVFETIFESYQTGQPPRFGGVDAFQDMLHYSPKQGSQLNTLDGKAFHQRTLVTTDGSTVPTDIGMVKNLSQNLLYIGRSISGTYSIVKTNYGGYNIGSTWFSGIIRMSRNSSLLKVVPFFSQFGAGASVKFSLYKNYSTTDILNQTLTYATLGAIPSREIKVTNGNNVDCFMLGITWNHALATNTAAIIPQVEVFYDISEQELGTDNV